MNERRERNIQHEIPASLNNMGLNLARLGRFSEAEEYYLESAQVAKALSKLGDYYVAKNLLGDLYLEQGQPARAIPLFLEVVEERNAKNIDRRANVTTISNLIQAYADLNRPASALPYVESGALLMQEFPEQRNAAVDYYRESAKTYFMLNQSKKGNALLQQSMALRDSIFSSENAEKVANLETRFKVAEQDRNLMETRANLAERELEVTRKNKLMYGSFGLVIIIALLAYLVYNQQKLKNRQLQKEGELKTALARIETQNKLQEQRLRISRDLHDNIGSQLTFIISSIDTLSYGMKEASAPVSQKLSRISEFTSQTIYELRDTIWAMNKSHITLEDLGARIHNFIEKAGSVQNGSKFRFTIADDVSMDTSLSSVQGMNVYRIIQEAVNNALKHANAQQITVQIAKRGTTLALTIHDDGTGFEPQEKADGHGLANIRKRAKDLNGTVTIESAPQLGTTIEVAFPSV
ncbi:MAG: hypothetical protein CMC08_05235 [Flavobacteriaceae bacterium]|nr:hypothetical protein [Flavobacteriaceae bacterium]